MTRVNSSHRRWLPVPVMLNAAIRSAGRTGSRSRSTPTPSVFSSNTTPLHRGRDHGWSRGPSTPAAASLRKRPPPLRVTEREGLESGKLFSENSMQSRQTTGRSATTRTHRTSPASLGPSESRVTPRRLVLRFRLPVRAPVLPWRPRCRRSPAGHPRSAPAGAAGQHLCGSLARYYHTRARS